MADAAPWAEGNYWSLKAGLRWRDRAQAIMGQLLVKLTDFEKLIPALPDYSSVKMAFNAEQSIDVIILI